MHECRRIAALRTYAGNEEGDFRMGFPDEPNGFRIRRPDDEGRNPWKPGCPSGDLSRHLQVQRFPIDAKLLDFLGRRIGRPHQNDRGPTRILQKRLNRIAPHIRGNRAGIAPELLEDGGRVEARRVADVPALRVGDHDVRSRRRLNRPLQDAPAVGAKRFVERRVQLERTGEGCRRFDNRLVEPEHGVRQRAVLEEVSRKAFGIRVEADAEQRAVGVLYFLETSDEIRHQQTASSLPEYNAPADGPGSPEWNSPKRHLVRSLPSKEEESMPSPGLSKLRNVSARDQRMIQDIEVMIGPEPSEMGFVKNLFWGRFRNDVVLPYPHESADERARCDALLEELETYLKNEHPSIQIDQEEWIPEWCIRRLFDMGVLGLTIPEEYGGLGLGVTSYNRVLECIGSYCASTAVVVSAHQSIGCKAIMLFGSEEQKKRFLPGVAREYLSAFCLSEPNVGSDAAGQETHCERSDDGDFFILNGEKKWSTSAATSGVFTVMAKQKIRDPRTGKTREGVTALICTPDMDGIEIFEKNRSKAGIRGTWQGRIRFTNVRVPRANLLHHEGKGLSVALNCLNYGRCTLSAGVLGAAKRAMNQSTKWVQTRYQFDRPLADFELVQEHIAFMAAYTYAMESMLYMMTAMLDRRDADIMVETAITKVFCSHYGWEAIDRALQIMGGEGFMTENELERAWRDNRIHRVVEGSNEVMQSFIFAYGGKQLAEQMLGIQEAVAWSAEASFSDNLSRIVGSLLDPRIFSRALSLGAQLFLGYRPGPPHIGPLHFSLHRHADRLARLIPLHAAAFKRASKEHREEIIQRQAVQSRVARSATFLFAMTCTLSRMERQIRVGDHGPAFQRDRAAFDHFFDLAEIEVLEALGALRRNADESMRIAARAARLHNDTLPNSDYYIHEASPIAQGTGKAVSEAFIKQFPGESREGTGAPGHPAADEVGGDGHSRATREGL